MSRIQLAKKKRAKHKRDPDITRVAILEAASALLAIDGPEGLSLSQVANLARVNRGTVYQHFQTREELLAATTKEVSEKLCRAVFGDPTLASDQGVDKIDARGVVEHLAEFAMENPELGRVWLFELLSSSRPASDPFWKQYKSRFKWFAQSEFAQPGIDIEVHAVQTLIGVFLWPVWARAHVRSAKGRQQMAKRYSREVLRQSLHGTMRPEQYPELDAKATNTNRGRS